MTTDTREVLLELCDVMDARLDPEVPREIAAQLRNDISFLRLNLENEQPVKRVSKSRRLGAK